MKVAREGDKLVLRFGKPEFMSDLEHWRCDAFEAHWNNSTFPKAKVTFVLTPEGKADELRFDLAGHAGSLSV